MNLSKKHFLVILILIQINFSFGQGFRLDDPNLIFKDQNGQVLSVDSVKKIAARGPFSMQQNALENGKTEVVITPMSSEDLKRAEIERAKFKEMWTGKSFPSFELATLKDKSIKRNDLEGKVTVINFWFIGCKPCQQEIPKLNEVVSSYNQHGDNIQFIAPSFDSKEALIRFSTKKTFNYTILYEADPLIKQMQITSYPTHIILDRKGMIREVLAGASEDIDKRLRSAIDIVLKEK